MKKKFTGAETAVLYAELQRLLHTFRGMTHDGYDEAIQSMKDIIKTLSSDLEEFPPGPQGRKIIQRETCQVNRLEVEGSIHVHNAMFALCNDGTFWMQLIGGGEGWTPIDGPPQGEIEEAPEKTEAQKVAESMQETAP